MKGIKDLLKDLSEGDFADNFKGCANSEELAARARELSYDVSAEDIEEATDLSADSLAFVAGGTDFSIGLSMAC